MIGKALKALIVGAIVVFLFNSAPTILVYILVGVLTITVYNSLKNKP